MIMWSLGKNPDPRVVLVLRAMRGVAIGVKDGVAPDEREAWVSTFSTAGDEALARRDFQDAIFHLPESRPRFRIRAYWAAIAFGFCSIVGFAVGAYASHYDASSRNAAIDEIALPILGVVFGIAFAALLLLGKFAVFASRPARDAASQKLLEERFRRIDSLRRSEAVKRVLAGGDRTRVAEEYGVALESLDAWGAVYLDAAQVALKQRFGAAN